MRAPLRLDIGWRDLAAGFAALRRSPPREQLEQRLARRLSGRPDALATLSVRSALDLFLQAAQLPRGSDVLVSAITHPDIVEIVRLHGLTPIPVDVDLDTAAPTERTLERALTPNSRAVIVAHLFGGRIDLGALIAFCRRHDLLLLEDCAQMFGAGYAGHSDADAVFFSFGPLKTATALGGALVRVRDESIRRRMDQIQRDWPIQPDGLFAKRLVKYGLLQALTQPVLYGLFCETLRRSGRDPTTTVRGWTRSFAGGFDVARLRWRPATALLALLDRRLARHSPAALAPRIEAARRASCAMPDLRRPGHEGLDHSHWLFPILTTERDQLREALWRAGFHLLPGLSNLEAVPPPTDRPDLAPVTAREIIATALTFQVPANMADGQYRRLAAAAQLAATETTRRSHPPD